MGSGGPEIIMHKRAGQRLRANAAWMVGVEPWLGEKAFGAPSARAFGAGLRPGLRPPLAITYATIAAH